MPADPQLDAVPNTLETLELEEAIRFHFNPPAVAASLYLLDAAVLVLRCNRVSIIPPAELPGGTGPRSCFLPKGTTSFQILARGTSVGLSGFVPESLGAALFDWIADESERAYRLNWAAGSYEFRATLRRPTLSIKDGPEDFLEISLDVRAFDTRRSQQRSP